MVIIIIFLSCLAFPAELCKFVNDLWDFPGGLVIKNPHANAGCMGLIPGLGRSPGEGYGNPLQYSCLGNPMDRGAWQAIVHGVQRVRHDLASKQQQQSDLWTPHMFEKFTHTHTNTHKQVSRMYGYIYSRTRHQHVLQCTGGNLPISKHRTHLNKSIGPLAMCWYLTWSSIVLTFSFLPWDRAD